MSVRLYVSEHCTPCKDVKDLIAEGRYTGADKVEVVDIETEEGFAEFQEKVLDKQAGAVPSAFEGVNKCEILYDEEADMLVFKCPTSDPASNPKG